MGFKVEGSWNTEKYYRSRWLSDKKKCWILDALEWLKQYHFDFAVKILIFSALKLFLFFFISLFLFPAQKNRSHGPLGVARLATSGSGLSVNKGMNEDNACLLTINEHCFVKNESKTLLFSLKTAIKVLSRKYGGIQGAFLTFNRVFNRAH